MIKNNVEVYALIFNKTSLKYEVLSLEETKIVPINFTINEQDNLDKKINETLERHIDLSSKFFSYLLSDVYTKDKCLHIIYYCLIPYNTKIENSYLINIDVEKIYPENLRKVLLSLS